MYSYVSKPVAYVTYSAMTLWQLPINKTGLIRDYVADADEKYIQRLKDLGFCQNETIICVRQLPFSGPRVYQVQNSVYALEKELADCVEVVVSGE